MVDSHLVRECESRCGSLLLGKWRLEAVLGIGGMAAVYRGVHRIGRVDAIKILHREIAQSSELCRRFEQEATAVNRFRHPGAVEIHDIDISEDGCPFLVMELLDGETLKERVQRQEGLAVGQLLGFVDELLDVLGAAHAQHIVHRDIKLDNLFVTRDERLKVLDFGIARVRSGINTVAGMTLGTAAYMAPEQVRGAPVDGRADLFSVGATMFRVLAKRRIHDADSEAEMLLRMGTERAPPLLSVCSSASPEVAAIVDRALQFLPEERYESAEAMQRDVRAAQTIARPFEPLPPPPIATPPAKALRAAASSAPARHAPHAVAPPLTPVQRKPPRRARRRWPLIAAGASIALLATVGGIVGAVATTPERTAASARRSAEASTGAPSSASARATSQTAVMDCLPEYTCMPFKTSARMTPESVIDAATSFARTLQPKTRLESAHFDRLANGAIDLSHPEALSNLIFQTRTGILMVRVRSGRMEAMDHPVPVLEGMRRKPTLDVAACPFKHAWDAAVSARFPLDATSTARVDTDGESQPVWYLNTGDTLAIIDGVGCKVTLIHR